MKSSDEVMAFPDDGDFCVQRTLAQDGMSLAEEAEDASEELVEQG